MLGDVHGGADVAGISTVGREPGRTGGEDPTVLAVVSPEPELHLIGLATVERLTVVVDQWCQIVGVHAVGPAVSELSFVRPSGELEPGAIDVVTALVGTRHPEHHRRGIGHQAEALLALAQPVLDFDELGDVGGDTQHAHGVPFAA